MNVGHQSNQTIYPSNKYFVAYNSIQYKFRSFRGAGGIMGIDHYDVIVVGGGIMGSCTAYECSKRGFSTLLLEQFDFLHNRGSSHGESRTLRLTYAEPYYRDLVLHASQLWDQAQSESGYRVLYPTSHLDLGSSHELALQALIANSPGCRVLQPHQLSHHLSGRVRVPEGWVGVVTKGAAVVKPTKAVSMFQALALRNGAHLKDNTKVIDITRAPGGGILVTTARGQKIGCNKCVVANGVWMKKLVSEVTGHEIPINPVETTIYYWRVKAGYEEEYSLQGGFPSFASYGNPYYYGTPSLEYPGLIKVAMHGGQWCEPENRTWAPHPELTKKVREWVKEQFEGRVEYEEGPVSTQSCMYSMTPDEDYVIDFLGGDLGNDVVIAGGFSGHGFKMGPIIGHVVAELLVHGEAPLGIDLRHFKLSRFQNTPRGNFKGFAEQVGFVNPMKSKL